MTIENYFAEKLNKFQRKFNLNTVYSNPYHTAFGQVEESQENADHQIKLATMVRELQEDFADKYGKNKYIELGTKDIVDFAAKHLLLPFEKKQKDFMTLGPKKSKSN